LTGQGVCSKDSTLYYIPTADEIILNDRKTASGVDVEQRQKDFLNKPVEFFNLDESLTKAYKRPTLVKAHAKEQYKLEGTEMFGVRKVWFNETSAYSEKETYKLLVYLTQILGIFDLEYVMMRNVTKGVQLLELEAKTTKCRPFWSEVDQKLKKMEKKQLEEPIDPKYIEN
jgi:hypothetical protein